jgi:FixJ family two-component response regulator
MKAVPSEGMPPLLLQGLGMRDESPSVLIIDDDPEFRDSVARLLRSVGLQIREFSSVSEFCKADPPDGPSCLVLDVRMPGGSGLELQRDLVAANKQLPIIFITAHADVPMTVQAMKGGAIEFLTKPFRDQELLDAVETGQIAHNIGIAESTVKVHRTHLMRKMKAHSLPELSRMADILKVTA